MHDLALAVFFTDSIARGKWFRKDRQGGHLEKTVLEIQ